MRKTDQNCSSSSGMLSSLFSLAGGVGLGAGLLYLLDPDKGSERRHRMMDSAADLASSAKDLAANALGSVGDYAGGTLGTVRDYAMEKLHGASNAASDQMSSARGMAQSRINQVRDLAYQKAFGETPAQRRLNVSICALSSMALGAAIMYIFDPNSGRNRRQYVRQQAGTLAHEAGAYAQQAGEAIKSGAQQIRDKVMSRATGGAAESHEHNQASL